MGGYIKCLETGKRKNGVMTPKEIVLGGYQSFSEGKFESLGKIFHEKAVIKVSGNHKRSGEYKGFEGWRDNFLSHLPTNYPNFDLQILHVVAEGDRVHVFVKYTADNLDANGVHMFLVEDGLETEFIIFDDTQKMAAALGN
jgi:ketosteroid isomerase-like protein